VSINFPPAEIGVEGKGVPDELAEAGFERIATALPPGWAAMIPIVPAR